MLSVDTNILLPAVVKNHASHLAAAMFFESINDRPDVVVSEFTLLELYVLLRNPAVMKSPLGAEAALEVCNAFRLHPTWQICGFPENSASYHKEFWTKLGKDGFARRRAYDWRTALALQSFGVDEFATANIKDFEGLGFKRVWNPLAA
jgi:predicted nucleic acid-binding protein